MSIESLGGGRLGENVLRDILSSVAEEESLHGLHLNLPPHATVLFLWTKQASFVCPRPLTCNTANCVYG